MAKSKILILVIFSALLFLSFSFASAGLFDFVKGFFNGGITGNVIADSSKIINIDFGSENTTKTGSAAVGSNGDFWNSMRAYSHLGQDYFVSSLKFANGQPSTAFMNVIGFYSTWELNYGGVNDPMFNNYIYSYQTSTRPVSKIVLSKIPVGVYDIYIYGHEGDYGEQYELNSGGVSYGVMSTIYSHDVYTTTSWTESLHYVVFQDVSIASTKNLTITVGNLTNKKSYSGGIINGIQIVPANTDRINQSQTRVDGVCGITLNDCVSGDILDFSNNQTHYLWGCAGQNGGRTVNCSLISNETNQTVVVGICGFNLNTCNSGIFSDLTDSSTHYKWQCLGQGGGSSSSYCNITKSNNQTNQCTDSDGGLNYYIYGNASIYLSNGDLIGQYSDTCYQGSVYERYCHSNGSIVTAEFLCPFGCLNGACIQNNNNQTVNSSIRYVRQGAFGSGSGLNWSDAYTTLPSTLIRGFTYYIADGNYSGYTFDDPSSGSRYISIKKATLNDHGSDAGWISTYGDGQAVFNGPLLHNAPSGGYIEIDGQEQYGFKVDFNASYQGSLGFGFVQGGTGVQLKNIDFDGISDTGFYNYPYELNCIRAVVQSQVRDIFISNISCHGASTLLIDSAYNYNMTIQNSVFYNALSSSINYYPNVFASYGNGVTFRNNKIYNFVNGVMIFGNNGNFYNNIIYNSLTLNSYTIPRGFEVGYIQASPLNGVKIYGNTIVNVPVSGINFRVQCNGCEVKNNLGYNTSFISFGAGVSNVSNKIIGDPNMFANFLLNDYRLANSTINGTYLSSPYNKDFDGISRAVIDGNWDIGAYEYNTPSCNDSVTLDIVYNPDAEVQYQVGKKVYSIRTAYSGFGLYVNGEDLGSSQGVEVGGRYTLSDGAVFTILDITYDSLTHYIVSVQGSCTEEPFGYCKELTYNVTASMRNIGNYSLVRNWTEKHNSYPGSDFSNSTIYSYQYMSNSGEVMEVLALMLDDSSAKIYNQEGFTELLSGIYEYGELSIGFENHGYFVLKDGDSDLILWYKQNVLVAILKHHSSSYYLDSLGIEEFVRKVQDNEFVKIDMDLSDSDIDLFTSSFMNVCPSELEYSCDPEWQVKVEPVVCPEYGVQTEIWVDDSYCVVKPIEKSKKCSPGICSGCYSPRYDSIDAENICIPYGTRFERSAEPIILYEGYELEGTNGDFYNITIYNDRNAHLSFKDGVTFDSDIALWQSYSAGGEIFTVSAIVPADDKRNGYIQLTFDEEFNAYCNYDGNIYPQKSRDSNGDWASCQNNYECASNLCIDHECVEVESLAESTRSVRNTLIKLICRISSTFDFSETYNQCVDNAIGGNVNEPAQPTPTCVDSDGGLNYYLKGVVNGTPSGSATDVCSSSTELFEFRCEADGRVSGSYPYQCPFGCSNGACNQGNFTKLIDPENPDHYCLIEDSTNDKNKFGRRAYTDMRGGIIETVIDEDVCQGNNLWETRCFIQNGFLNRNAGLETCTSGLCANGACIVLSSNNSSSSSGGGSGSSNPSTPSVKSITIISPTNNQKFIAGQNIFVTFNVTGFNATSTVCSQFTNTYAGQYVSSNTNSCKVLMSGVNTNIAQSGLYYVGIRTEGITPQVSSQVLVNITLA